MMHLEGHGLHVVIESAMWKLPHITVDCPLLICQNHGMRSDFSVIVKKEKNVDDRKVFNQRDP